MMRLITRPPGLRATRGRGFTLIEMLVVLAILTFLITFFAKRFIAMGKSARVKATQNLIQRIGIALARYKAECGALPPDTGFGQSLSAPGIGNSGNVVTYDVCSLWRYLAQPVTKCAANGTPLETVGPFLTFKYDPTGFTELQTFDQGKNYYVVDAWGMPLGYVGSPKRVVHSRNFCDLFSAGPDRKTAQDFLQGGACAAYNDDGDVSEMGAAAMNGSLTAARAPKPDDPADLVLDDINNWDPQR